ncbi:MAG: DUF4351 domain-containing protein [Leptolyngbyaceae cyanobacterium MO_188.B28]|nr:DUF4351 domain-containing protein [Leptolyngbyaceae cyanobacterium MO_188.B28]
MQKSVIYQDIKAEGIQEGLQQGLQQEGKLLVLRLLNRKVGTLPAELTTQVEALSLQQIEALGEALLDFEGREDLVHWLEMNMIE